jgi:hypothetical protein
MDKYLLAQAFSPSTQGEWILRQGEVVSVQSDYTMTVTIAGSSTEVTGVRSLSQPPPPGAGVWVMTNDTDLFAIGAIRAADRALAPRAYRTTDQAINNASATPIIWEGEDSDPFGFVTASAQSINVTVPGRYVAVGQVDFASNGTGVRSASIITGGSVVGAQRIGAFTGVAHLNVTSVPFTVSSTAAVELWVEQNSSASLNVVASDNLSPGLGVYYLG